MHHDVNHVALAMWDPSREIRPVGLATRDSPRGTRRVGPAAWDSSRGDGREGVIVLLNCWVFSVIRKHLNIKGSF